MNYKIYNLTKIYIYLNKEVDKRHVYKKVKNLIIYYVEKKKIK